MPKLQCPCGFVHDMSPIPDDGWLTIRAKDYDDLYPSESSGPDEMRAQWSELMKRAGGMYVCPQCGRLMWSPPGNDCWYEFQAFVPEDRMTPNAPGSHPT